MDLKAPAHLPQGNINQHLNSAGRRQFTASFSASNKDSSRLRPAFPVYLCEGFGKKRPLLRRNSRTALRYGERCGSITPPPDRKTQRGIHELVQQHISTGPQRKQFKMPILSKNIIYTQVRVKHRFGWQFWMGTYRTYSKRVKILLALLTLTQQPHFLQD